MDKHTAELKAQLTSAMDKLAPTERKVLRLRYFEGREWPDVVAEMNRLGLTCSEDQVTAIHAKALRSLRHPEGVRD